MFVIGFIASLSLAGGGAPAPAQTRIAILGVSATVVRTPPPPAITVRGAAVLITNPGAVGLRVEGGTPRRQADGTLRVEAAAGETMTITLTY